MPVQINEMIVRANILEPQDEPTDEKSPPKNNVNKDEIIKECTEIILEILKQKKDR